MKVKVFFLIIFLNNLCWVTEKMSLSFTDLACNKKIILNQWLCKIYFFRVLTGSRWGQNFIQKPDSKSRQCIINTWDKEASGWGSEHSGNVPPGRDVRHSIQKTLSGLITDKTHSLTVQIPAIWVCIGQFWATHSSLEPTNWSALRSAI